MSTEPSALPTLTADHLELLIAFDTVWIKTNGMSARKLKRTLELEKHGLVHPLADGYQITELGTATMFQVTQFFNNTVHNKL